MKWDYKALYILPKCKAKVCRYTCVVFEVPDVFSKNPGPILLKVHILFEEQQWFDICEHVCVFENIRNHCIHNILKAFPSRGTSNAALMLSLMLLWICCSTSCLFACDFRCLMLYRFYKKQRTTKASVVPLICIFAYDRKYIRDGLWWVCNLYNQNITPTALVCTFHNNLDIIHIFPWPLMFRLDEKAGIQRHAIDLIYGHMYRIRNKYSPVLIGRQVSRYFAKCLRPYWMT